MQYWLAATHWLLTMTDDNVVPIEIPSDQWTAMEQAAKQQGVTLSVWVKQAFSAKLSADRREVDLQVTRARERGGQQQKML